MLIETILLAAATIFASVFLHFEALRLLASITRRRPSGARGALFLAISGLILTHIAEIALFGVAFYLSVRTFGLGTFVDARSMSTMDYFYYAAETYSSLGYGDIYPLGDIRLLASVTPLIGLLLLGWSSTFLFSLIDIDGERR